MGGCLVRKGWDVSMQPPGAPRSTSDMPPSRVKKGRAGHCAAPNVKLNRESGLCSGLLPLLLVILATRELFELGKHARLFLGRGFLALLHGLRLHDLSEPVRGRLFGRQQRAAFFDLCALLSTVNALRALLDL